MGHLSKHMQKALEAVRDMPAEQQDLLAIKLLDRAQSLARAPTELTVQELAELEAELAAARRGEFASDAEVAAMYAKYGQ